MIWKPATEVPETQLYALCRQKNQGHDPNYTSEYDYFMCLYDADGKIWQDMEEQEQVEWLDPSQLSAFAVIEKFLERVKYALMPHELLDAQRIIKVIDEQLNQMRSEG